MPVKLWNSRQDGVDELAGLAQALDEISWQWLSDNHPRLAEAIQDAVGSGMAPDRVRRFVMAHTQRYELALRCEQAARWANRPDEI